MIQFLLNDRLTQTDRPPGTLILDYVRYHKRLTGTKIGCREGDCGACTVLVGELKDGQVQYQSMTSCLLPLANAHGKHIITIEGVNLTGLSPAQQCLADEGGTQCGFCTPGFIMSLTGFCMSPKEPTCQNAITAIDGNICRCTGYKSIERAAAALSAKLQTRPAGGHMQWLVENGFLPEYFASVTVKLQALQQQIADENQLHTSSQVYVGGGTDLFVQRPEAMAKSDVHLLYGQPKLKGIWLENGHCHIGGGTTIEEMRQSELMHSMFPRLMPHTKLVSSSPIRNMATVAGNFVNGSPIGDLTIFFLALDSTVILERDGRTRELKLRHLYKGYKTLDRHPAEKLTGLYFEAPDATTHFNFEKVSKRTHLDIASVNTALQLRVSGGIITCAHLSAGGVGPIPLYLSQASAYLAGRPVSEQTLHQAANLAQQEIAPISDARGTEAYKRLLLRQLISAHFLTLFPKDITPACIALA